MKKNNIHEELESLCNQTPSVDAWRGVIRFLDSLPAGRAKLEMIQLANEYVNCWDDDFRLFSSISDYPMELRQLGRYLRYYRGDIVHVTPSLEEKVVQPYSRLDILWCDEVKFSAHFFDLEMWPQLNSLHIHSSGIYTDDWDKLVESGFLPRLKALTISHPNYYFSRKHLSKVLKEDLSKLESLRLSFVDMRYEHIKLISEINSDNLRKLNLSKNEYIDSKGLRKLTSAKFWMNMEEINIFKTSIFPEEIEELKKQGKCSPNLKVVSDRAINILL